MRETLHRYLTRIAPVMFAVAFFCSADKDVVAQKIKLTLQDAPLTILKDNTATKKINGIASQTPGSISLRIKWHAMTLIPNTFNKLKIELLHGSTVTQSKECYSVHSRKDPMCFVSETVTQAEANASGDWKLRITNRSDHDVNGFNILKEITDLNPTVTNVESFFQPDCNIRYPSLSETEIATGATVTRILTGIPNLPGELHLRAKWHVDALVPFFNPLTITLLRDGQIVESRYAYSIHSDQKDKFQIKINVTPNPGGSSTWELRISNQYLKVKGFGIEKGNDSNPFVPQFRSTFKPSCN